MRISPIAILLILLFTGFSSCGPQPKEKNDTSSDLAKDSITAKTSDTPNSPKDNRQIASAAEIMSRPEVPVLCYHRVRQSRPNDTYSVNEAAFKAQMQMLSDSGYHTISPDQLYNYLAFGDTLPGKPVLLTFDDNRIEHFDICAPVLESHGQKGTFFIMTITMGKKNYMSREQIKALSDRGHTIGCHSWDHHDARKYTTEDWQKQSVEPQQKLAEIIGKPVEYWAYPFGSNNHGAAAELAKYYKLSFILADKRDPELPLQMVRRLMVPYNWTAERMLRGMKATFKH